MKMTLKILLVFMFFFGLCIVKPTTSDAYWHRHSYVSFSYGWSSPYYYGYDYDDYPYYGPYYAPYYYPVASYPAAYAVESPAFQPVVINGVTYYVNNGVYYTYGPYGYQVVATPAGAPAQAAEAPQASDNTITVNVPNGKGGYTPVVLKKSGSGFVGPQGEFYARFPKVSQLETMYGK
ncbi:MAG: hypothetical protein KGJ09_02475 [Candidatus Omnitrophica bacterium]|nr:hypothetical protein [Candidatus Omnitrophota bacterium]MDE2008924.1 hypothetical protein [Candidatus Omnitrophota bacterium]MDE2230586.1 hypothetical protein [Candidatus Omnitrophota bacterium]